MNDEELRIEADRGRQAKALMEHNLVIEAFDAFDSKLFEEWKNSPIKDAEGREQLRRMSYTVDKFREYFETLMTAGENADVELAMREKNRMRDKLRIA